MDNPFPNFWLSTLDNSYSNQPSMSFQILDNLMEGIQIIDFNWIILYINNAAERHNKRSNSELLGKNYVEKWPGIEKTMVFQRIKSCMERRIPELLENEFIYPDGSVGWFELRIQPVPAGVFIASFDITDRKLAEKESLDKDEKFKQVFESANVGKSITRITGEIEVNSAFANMLGYEKEEIQNVHWKSLTPPEDIPYTEEKVNSLLSGKTNSLRFNKRYIHKNGSILWTDVNTAIYRDTEGNPLYFITTVIDISKQKKAETNLLRSEHLLKLFVEHAPAAIAMFDKDMRYLIVSNRFLSDYGISGKVLVGKSHYEIFPEIPIRWKEIHKHCLNGNTDRAEEDPFPRADGKMDWIHWEIHPWYESDGEIGGIILFSEVITQRVQAKQALRRSEDLFNKAFHGSPSPMVISRISDGAFIAVNDSFVRMLEVSREEIMGKNGIELNLIEPEYRTQIINELQQKGHLQNIEIRTTLKSGKEIYALLSIEITELAGEKCSITTMLDITERKLAELQLKEKNEEIEAHNEEYQQLNEELLQINEELKEAKLRAEESDHLKTAFLHNVSHEIRTPMNAIVGFIGLLKNSELQKEKQQRYYGIIEQSSSQLLTIITDIIDIASIEAGQVKIYKEPVKINWVLNLLYEQFVPVAESKGIRFSCIMPLSDKEAILVTDETKLIQILTNLLNNAFKFTKEGQITFGYEQKELNIEFYVEDTGIGIATEMHEKIFNRFHQVESGIAPNFGGSGLGLSISKGYVELLGGNIGTVSKPEKGSRFYFTVPLNTNNH